MWILLAPPGPHSGSRTAEPYRRSRIVWKGGFQIKYFPCSMWNKNLAVNVFWCRFVVCERIYCENWNCLRNIRKTVFFGRFWPILADFGRFSKFWNLVFLVYLENELDNPQNALSALVAVYVFYMMVPYSGWFSVPCSHEWEKTRFLENHQIGTFG